MKYSLALGIVVLVLGAAGCNVVPSHVLGAGPVSPGDPRLLDDVILAVRGAGYRPLELEPESGRFELVAQSDRRGETRFVVQCFSDGWVSILPVGPGVTESDGHLSMPRALRNEYGALAEAIDEGLVVMP
jgi:hypothetical protein